MKKVFKNIGKILIVLLIVGLVGGGIYFYKTNPDFFTPEYMVTFDSNGAELAKTKVKSKKGKCLELPVIQKEGYNFDGWYCNDTKWSNETPINANMKLVAKFTPIKYKITFIVDSNEYYSYTDYDSMPSFPNGTPEKDAVGDIAYKFVGFNPELSIVKGEATYTAVFEEYDKNSIATISFCVDGVMLNKDSFKTQVDSVIEIPKITTSNYGMSAYNIDGWYTDSECTSMFDINSKISGNITLYGKWVSVLDNGFYKYLDKFNKAKNSKTISIESEEELIAWIEYVQFNNILKDDAVKIKFGTKITDYKVVYDNKEDLQKYVQNIINKNDFPNSYPLYYSYFESEKQYTLATFFFNEDNLTKQASKTADLIGENTITQYEFAFLNELNVRDSSFDDFNIKNVKDEISVTTSSQLVYALEKGLKPVVVKNSKAEIIYNKAKDVLREICNDKMTDFDKVKAIYDWLVLNVQYDHKASSTTEICNNWQEYDAWYPEGVFLNHKAVCDGITRSFLILCKLENIACIRVSGKYNGVGHAWNKVYLDGNWYGVDATHGDSNVNNKYEILTYSSFLFTDDFKLKNCEFDVETDTKTPNSAVNVYANMSFGDGVRAFDLYINNLAEFENLLYYVEHYTSNSDYYKGETNHQYFTLEFVLAEGSGLSSIYVRSKLGATSYVTSQVDGDLTAYAFVIKLS